MNKDLFQHKFFRFFGNVENIETDPPDIEYTAILNLKIDFEDYDTYFFISETNEEKVKSSLSAGLKKIKNDTQLISILKIGSQTRVQLCGLDLYSFHWLVKYLQNDMGKGSICGFSTHNDFSFIIINDSRSLNNIVGKTSNNEVFSFNLTNGQSDFFAISEKIRFTTKYKISTLKRYVSMP